MPLPEKLFGQKITWSWIGKGKNASEGRPVFKATRGKEEFVIKYESRPNRAWVATYSDEAVGLAEFRRSALVMAYLYRRVAEYKATATNPGRFPDHALLTSSGIETFKKSLGKNVEAATFLNTFLTAQSGHWCPFFIAMELVTPLYELDVEKTTNEDQWKQARRNLLGTPLFYSLGKVAAVDYFTGNQDRFHGELASGIQNPGNIFFTGTNSADTQAIGLDFFDPTSQWTNLFSSRSVEAAEQGENGSDYPGSLLEASQMTAVRELASKVIAGICDIVAATPAQRASAREYEKAFFDGFQEGREALQHTISNESARWQEKKFLVGGKAKIDRKSESKLAIEPYPAYQLWIRADFLGLLASGELQRKFPLLGPTPAMAGQ